MVWKRALAAVLVVAGIIFGAAGILSVYVRDTLIDSDEAAERAITALTQPEVRQLIADTVVDQMVKANPDLLAARPVLSEVVSGVIAAPVFHRVYESAIRDLHRTVFLGDIDTFTVQLTDMVLIVKKQAAVLSPELAEQIPDDLIDTLIDVQSNPQVLDAVQIAENIRFLAFALPLVAIAAFGSSIFLADNRRQAWVRVGMGAVGIGVIILVIESAAGWLIVRGFEEGAARDVASAFWNAFAADLYLWALAIAAIGTIMVAAVWWISEPANVTARLGQFRRFLEPPSATVPRLTWVLGWGLIGVFLILSWQNAVRIIVTLLGVLFLVNALAEFLRMIAPGQLEAASGGDIGVSRTVLKWLAAAGGLAAAAVIVLGYFAIDRSAGPAESAVAVPAGAGCNGHLLLCDRRLDDIAIAAAHNAMSSAEDGFVLANHSRGIIPQLEAGYRGLLIDVYPGIESERSAVVVTDVAPATPADRLRLVEQLGETAVRSAEELHQRNLDAGGKRELYLCHLQCESGATPFAAELERIRGWLEENPREALVIIIEDHAPPDDIAAAFAEAGLVEYTHTQAFDAPWPTLREMIDSGRRLVVMAENDTGGVPWYHDAFTFTQETPYHFETVAEFSCAPNRGREDSPLFMVNHWVTPALAEVGSVANSARVVNDRIATCREERGLSPNIIGVDFYASGDALAVVDSINGVR